MAGDAAPSGATMVDAQLTTVRVLRPFAGFEKIYQGKDSLIPIAFPGVPDARAQAHKPGFDPRLLAGISVPEGARVLLWLPMCFTNDIQSLTPFQFYEYRLIWRYQNLASYRDPPARAKRTPFHFARQSPGAFDTTLGAPGIPRGTIPASWHAIAHEEVEPTTGASTLNIRVEQIIPRLDDIRLFFRPLLPSGQEAVVEQAITEPALVAGPVMPIFVPFWTDAEGDELIIFANRVDTEQGETWDFTDNAKDFAFSNIYGTGNGTHSIFRDLGTYMQT